MGADRDLVLDTWLGALIDDKGPHVTLASLKRALDHGSGPLRAMDWWPEPVNRAEVDRLKARLQTVTREEQIPGAGAFAVALVETLAEIIADTATTSGYASAVLNLIPALDHEVVTALPTGTPHLQ
jgi:hypothetical protein